MNSKPIYSLALVLLIDADRAGWYITGNAHGQESRSISPIRITATQAEEIGRTFEEMLPANLEPDIHPFGIIREGSTEAKIAIKELLDKAEKVAESVPALRKAVEELNG